MHRLANYKKYFLHTMIISLVIGALVGIISILAGSFSDTSGRVVACLVSIIIHSLLSFYVIPSPNNEENFKKMVIFNETLFVLLAASFVTSLLAIWGLFTPDLTWKLYLSFGSIGSAALLSNILLLLQGKSKQIDTALLTGVFSTMVLLVFVLVAIFAQDSLDDFYYRLMAVVGIVAGTSSVVTAVLYKLYLQAHPEEQNVLDARKSGIKILKFLGWLVLIYIIFNILLGLLFLAAF